MNTTDIILPWNKPLINLIPETDIVLTLATNNLQKNLPSLMENYINIRYQTDFNSKPFASFVGDHSEWYRFKFLSVQSIPHWMISPENLKDIIHEALSHKNYVFCNINTKYIHNYVNYKRDDFRHSISIYGLSCDQLSICDYFDYQVRQNEICSFDEFSAALHDYIFALNENRSPFYPNLADHLNGILLFKEKDQIEGFELSNILFELRNFLYPTPILQKEQKISYGINFFRVLCEYLENNSICHNEKNYTKLFQLISAHVLLMKMRVNYLNEHYWGNSLYLSNIFKHLVTTAITIRNKYIRILVSNYTDMYYFKELSTQIYEFYKNYQEVLHALADNLESFV